MTPHNLEDIVIKNINHLNTYHKVSLRQLSTDIECSDSYMQKVVSKQISISLKRLTQIADRYEIHVASLLEDNMQQSEKIRQVNEYLIHLDDTKLDLILQLVQTISDK